MLLFCLGCIGVLALGPRLVRLPFVSRSERVGLLGLGVPRDAAVNFSLASGMLLTGAALVAALVGVGGSLLYTLQRRRFARATIA